MKKQIDKIASIVVDKTTRIDSFAGTKLDTVIKKIEKESKIKYNYHKL